MTLRRLTTVSILVMVASVGRAQRPGERLPAGAIARIGTSHFQHSMTVTALDFSPDSKTIATGTQDGFICLWDTAGGYERARWRHDNIWVKMVSFAPDGRSIAGMSSNGTLHVWTLEGKQIFSRSLPGHELLLATWLADAGRLVVATRRSGVAVYDVTTGGEVKVFPSKMTSVSGLAVSPDGKRIVLRDQASKMICFDLETGREVFTFEDSPGRIRTLPQAALFRYTPDGKAFVAEFSTLKGPVFWDAATGKLIRQFDAGAPGRHWALSPNGRFVACSSTGNSNLRVLGLASGLEIRSLTTSSFSSGLRFSPDGKLLAAIVGGNSLQLFNLADGDVLHKDTGHAGMINGLAFLDDGRLLSTGADRTVRAWDVRKGMELDRESTPGFLYNMVREPGGQSALLVANNGFFRWQPGSAVTPLRVSSVGGNPIIAPDGRRGLLHNGPQLSLVELADNREPVPLKTNASHIHIAALAPGGRWLAYLDGNGHSVIHIRDLIRGVDRRPINGSPGNPLYSEKLLFSPDGRLFASLYAGRATLVWEAATGLLRASLPRPEPHGTMSAIFSPDGRYLAMGLQNGSIYIHDLRTRRIAGPITGHRGSVNQLAYSVDGTLLASGGQDAGILVWDVAVLLEKLPQPKPIVAPTADQLDTWWSGLASLEGGDVSEAVGALAASPAAALALLAEKLIPVSSPDARQIAQWVRDLGDAKFTTREQAQRRLAALGDAARQALLEGERANPNPEARKRISRLLATLVSQVSPEYLRVLRAMEVLEKIGTSPARDQMEKLARETTDPDLSEEARGILARWKK